MLVSIALRADEPLFILDCLLICKQHNGNDHILVVMSLFGLSQWFYANFYRVFPMQARISHALPQSISWELNLQWLTHKLPWDRAFLWLSLCHVIPHRVAIQSQGGLLSLSALLCLHQTHLWSFNRTVQTQTRLKLHWHIEEQNLF